MMARLLAAAALVAAFSTTASAWEDATPDEAAGAQTQAQAGQDVEPATFSVGLGIIAGSNPYKDADTRVTPMPLIEYTGVRFAVRGLTARYRAAEGSWGALSLIAAGRLEGYDEDDSDALEGMDDREWSMDAGVGYILQARRGSLQLEALTDVLGRSDGQEVRLRYSYPLLKPFGSEKLLLVGEAGIAWRSARLNDYYYGVRGEEAITGRPAYDAGSGFNVFAGLGGSYLLSERWSVIGNAGVTRLSDEIADSSIVDQDYVVSGFLGALCRL